MASYGKATIKRIKRGNRIAEQLGLPVDSSGSMWVLNGRDYTGEGIYWLVTSAVDSAKRLIK